MRLKKKIVLGLFAGFVTIQFIQPARNKSDKIQQNDIKKIYAVPDKVLAILQNSCYDCHSNNTQYPWYSFIQPVAWWMSSHIRKGKANLNFSEFGTYSTRKQQSKLQAIVNSIKDETMPISSYALLHKSVKLTIDDKAIMRSWVEATKDSLSLSN